MVKSCCAKKCTERARKGSGISFHSFPKDEILRIKWIIATKRTHFYLAASTRICSKHFIESDYVQHFGQLRLKKDSVPTVFNFPYHFIKTEAEENSSCSLLTPHLIKVEPEESASKCTPPFQFVSVDIKSSIPSTRNTRIPTFFRDFKFGSLESEEAKSLWRAANRQISKHQKLTKSLRNKQQKLQKTNRKLKDSITRLKKCKKE